MGPKAGETAMVARKIKRNIRQDCLETFDDDVTLMFVDGHDDAIVGFVERDGILLLVYDADKIVRMLVVRDRMSREDAEEYFEFNVAGAWMGEQTPLILRRFGG